MKTVTKLSIIFLATLIISPVFIYAQKVRFEKEFSINEDSKREAFTFEVKEGTKELIIDFEGIISTGGLKVKITDPEGNQISGFSLKASKNRTRTFSYDLDAGSTDAKKKEKAEKAEKDKKEVEEVKETRETRETRQVREIRAEAREARASARSSSRSSTSSSSSSSNSGSSVSVSAETDESGHSVTKTNKTHIYTKEKTETSESGARGVINKEITNPVSGTWQFTIYPDDAKGKLLAKIMYK